MAGEDFSTRISGISGSFILRLQAAWRRFVTRLVTFWGISDREQYGESLLDKLADELGKPGVPRTQSRELRRYRLFYTAYPQIRETLSPELNTLVQLPANLGDSVSQVEAREFPGSTRDPSELIEKLSFSHFVELLAHDDDTKRIFYEIECIPELMVMFNHSSQKQTLDYLCIQPDEIRDAYMKLEL